MNQQRKRGDELIQAIYDSAIEIMNDEGYDSVNFMSIAKRAKTGRAVLYRRWNTPFELLFDAIRARNISLQGTMTEIDYDTGALRTDFIELFTHFLKASRLTGREFLRAFIHELNQKSEFLEKIYKELRIANLLAMNRIIERSIERGEMVRNVDDYVKLMPFELLRYELIINQNELTTEFIEKLVDEIMLPILIG